MADGAPPDRQLHMQTYPPPPSFFKMYTTAGTSGTGEKGGEGEPSPPPPPPPIEGEYQMFGELHTTEDGIPPLQGRQLFEMRPDGTVDFRGQLLRLNRELLFNFVELLGTLADAPSGYARGVEALGLLVRNMHYLLNALRAQQARATLQHMLEVEVSDKQDAIADIRKELERSRAQIAEAANALQQVLV